MNYTQLQLLLPNDELHYISDSTEFFKDNDMKLDDIIKGDTGVKKISAFRMNLNRYAVDSEKTFKTRVVDGELIIGRIL